MIGPSRPCANPPCGSAWRLRLRRRCTSCPAGRAKPGWVCKVVRTLCKPFLQERVAAALAEALQQLSCGVGSDCEGERGAERVWGEAEAGCSAAPGGDGRAAAGALNLQGAYGPQEGLCMLFMVVLHHPLHPGSKVNGFRWCGLEPRAWHQRRFEVLESEVTARSHTSNTPD